MYLMQIVISVAVTLILVGTLRLDQRGSNLNSEASSLADKQR